MVMHFIKFEGFFQISIQHDPNVSYGATLFVFARFHCAGTFVVESNKSQNHFELVMRHSCSYKRYVNHQLSKYHPKSLCLSVYASSNQNTNKCSVSVNS